MASDLRVSTAEVLLDAAATTGDVAASGLATEEVRTIAAAGGMVLQCVLPSATSIATGFSLGSLGVLELDSGSFAEASVQVMMWPLAPCGQLGDLGVGGMLSFFLRMIGSSVALRNLQPPLPFRTK